jgi:hypothetical protein
MRTDTIPITVFLKSGHTWAVQIEEAELEKLDDLLWRKDHNQRLFKGDAITVWFNGNRAPLPALDCRDYTPRRG